MKKTKTKKYTRDKTQFYIKTTFLRISFIFVSQISFFSFFLMLKIIFNFIYKKQKKNKKQKQQNAYF